jgi:hypothetical protein
MRIMKHAPKDKGCNENNEKLEDPTVGMISEMMMKLSSDKYDERKT